MDVSFETIKAWNILTTKIELWITSFVAMLPNLFVASIIMFVCWVVARALSRLIRRMMSHAPESHTVSRLISTSVRLIILFFGLFSALGILNLDKTVTSLLAGAGVIGLAIGFAFQEIAANFFSGILIVIRKPYREGDIVQIEKFIGTVSDITLRTTNLATPSGLQVLVPNKDMFTKPVINYTKIPLRRVELNVGVSYGEDLRRVEKIALEAVSHMKARLPDHPLEFFYEGFGDSSVNFELRFWIDFHKQSDFAQARHEAIILLREAFREAGISIPFPIRTLDFAMKGGQTLTEAMQPAGRSPSAKPEAATADIK